MSAKMRYLVYGLVFLASTTAASIYALQQQAAPDLYSTGLLGLNQQDDANDNRIVDRKTKAGTFDLQLLSADYHLDNVYMSMTGPRSNQPMIQLVEKLEPEKTVWMTGIKTDVVDAESLSPVSNEYFCHSNLTLNPVTSTPDSHNASLGGANATWRFFTLVPGRMDIQLPEGFGVPIKNGTHLDYFTMSLNQNDGQPERDVRMKTTIKGRYQIEKKPVKSLFRRALYVYQRHKPTQAEILASILHSDEHQGELCAEDCKVLQIGQTPSYFVNGNTLGLHPGETCCVPNASSEGIMKRFGEHNTIHWMVPPGTHIYRTEVTEQMELPSDTTAHYATGHLHPFGKSIKLVDMQTKETVLEITAESYNDKLGVKEMSEVRSTKGVPLHANRRYEMIAEYNNPGDKPIDAMAILYVYALEKKGQTKESGTPVAINER